MLALHTRTGDRVEAPVRFDAAALPADIVWADLLNPTPEETAFIERAAGLHLVRALEQRAPQLGDVPSLPRSEPQRIHQAVGNHLQRRLSQIG